MTNVYFVYAKHGKKLSGFLDALKYDAGFNELLVTNKTGRSVTVDLIKEGLQITLREDLEQPQAIRNLCDRFNKNKLDLTNIKCVTEDIPLHNLFDTVKKNILSQSNEQSPTSFVSSMNELKDRLARLAKGEKENNVPLSNGLK